MPFAEGEVTRGRGTVRERVHVSVAGGKGQVIGWPLSASRIAGVSRSVRVPLFTFAQWLAES